MAALLHPPRRLAVRSAHQFARRALERAVAYVEQGLVELREGAEPDAARTYAAVRGSAARPYVVAIDQGALAEHGQLAAGCTCVSAREEGPCRHVYAVLLALDLRAAPAGAAAKPSARGPQLIVDPIALVPFAAEELASKDAAWHGAAALSEGPQRRAARPAPAARGATGAPSSARPPASAGAPTGVAPPRSSSSRPTAAGHRGDAAGRLEGAATGRAEDPRAVPPELEPPPAAVRARGATRRDVPDWQVRLYAVRRAASAAGGPRPSPMAAVPAARRLHYVIDVEGSLGRGGLVIGIFEGRDGKGAKSRARPVAFGLDELERVLDPKDKAALRLLSATPLDGGGRGAVHGARRRTFHDSLVPECLYPLVLSTLAATERLSCRGLRVDYDDGAPWTFGLVLRPEDALRRSSEREWVIGGRLRRGEETVDLAVPLLLLADGLVLFADRIARLDAKVEFPWIVALRSASGVKFPERALPDVLAELCTMDTLPAVELEPGPGPTAWQTAVEPLRPRLSLGVAAARAKNVELRLTFAYGPTSFSWASPGSGEVDRAGRRLVLRDRLAEHAALERLRELGVRRKSGGDGDLLEIPVDRVDALAAALTQAAWGLDRGGA